MEGKSLGFQVSSSARKRPSMSTWEDRPHEPKQKRTPGGELRKAPEPSLKQGLLNGYEKRRLARASTSTVAHDNSMKGFQTVGGEHLHGSIIGKPYGATPAVSRNIASQMDLRGESNTRIEENISREMIHPRNELRQDAILGDVVIAEQDKGKRKMTPLQVEEMERDRRQQHIETSRTSDSPPMMPLHPPITPIMLPSPMMLPPPPMMPLQRTANNVHNLHHNSDVPPPVALGDFGRQTSASQYLGRPVQAQPPTPSRSILASNEGHHSYSVKDHLRSVHSPQSRPGSPVVSATAAGWDAQQRPRSVQSVRHRHGMTPPEGLATGSIGGLVGPGGPPRPMSSTSAGQECYRQASPLRPRSVQSSRNRAAPSPAFSLGAANLNDSDRCRSVQSAHSSSLASRPCEELQPVGSDAQLQFSASLSGGDAMQVDQPMWSSQGHYGEPVSQRSCSVQSARKRTPLASTASSQVPAILNNQSMQSAYQRDTTSLVVSHPREQSRPSRGLSGETVMEVDHPKFLPPGNQGHFREPPPRDSRGANSSRSQSASSFSTFHKVAEGHHSLTSNFAVGSRGQHSLPKIDLSAGVAMEMRSLTSLGLGTSKSGQVHDGDFVSRDSRSVPSTRDRSASVALTDCQVSSRAHNSNSPHRCHSAQSARHRSGVASPFDSDPQDVPGIHQALASKFSAGSHRHSSHVEPKTISSEVVRSALCPPLSAQAQSSLCRSGATVTTPVSASTSQLGTYPAPVSSTIFDHLPKPSQPTFNCHNQFLPSDTLHSSDSPQAPHRPSGASAGAAVNPQGEIIHQTSAPCPPNSQQVQDAPWKPISDFAALSEGATANVAGFSLGGAQPTTPSSSSASPSPDANPLRYRPGPLLSQAKAGGDDLHQFRRAPSAPRQSGVTSATNVRSERGPRTMTIDSLICYPDRDSQSNVSLSAMDLDKATAPTSDAPSSSQGLVDLDPHRAHSAQFFHNSASASSLPSEAAAQPRGLAQNTPDVIFESHNTSKSGVPSDPYNQMRPNFVDPAVTSNQALSSISNEAFSGAVRGSFNEPSGALSQDIGAQGRNLESSGSSRFSDAVQDVPGSFDQPSGQHLRNSQNGGGQACDPGLSGPSQSGRDQVSDTTQGVPRTLNQPSGLHLGLSQSVGGRNYDVRLSRPDQFLEALPDMLGSLYPPSGSYPPLSLTVDQQSYDPGSPLGSDMEVDCFLPRQQKDFLQGDATSNQRTFNQENLYNQDPLPTNLRPAGPSPTPVGAPLVTPIPKKPINFNFDEGHNDFDWGSSQESRPCDQRFHANFISEGERRMRSLSAPGLDLGTIPEDAEVPGGDHAGLDTILERLNGVQNSVDQTRKECREVMKVVLGSSLHKGKKKLKKTPKPKDPRDTHPFRMSFLRILRRHLFRLFNNAKNDNELFSRPAPTPEEIQVFESRQPGCIRISARNFSIDWAGPGGSPFNTEAETVFADDLLTRIVEDKWYQEAAPIPEAFTDVTYIRTTFHKQLKYLRKRFSLYQGNNVQLHQESLAHSSRYQRKRQLYFKRRDAVQNVPELKPFSRLFETVGIAGVSSDESDPDSPGDYRRVYPSWRGTSLEMLEWRIDTFVEELRQPKIGHRRIPGKPPRRRLHRDRENPEALARPRLPVNCYDPEWIKTLRTGELRDLQIDQTSYDFEQGESDFDDEWPGDEGSEPDMGLE